MSQTPDTTIDLAPLWSLAAHQSVLHENSLHGPDHWRRVERNAIDIAKHSGADILVVRLFSVLHDSRRQNEGHDPDHGPRAAAWASELRGQYFDLTDEQFDQLSRACFDHDRGRTSEDATIGTCWDADRLDLTRCGVTPVGKFLSTRYAKLLYP